MASIYRIITVGAPQRGGADAPIEANLGGIAKTNDRCPHTVINELVCEHIGRSLGLPIPPGLLARDSAGKLYFVSLDVSAEGKSLPPVDPRSFVTAEPRLAAGCLAFDILVANPDRHARNLARDHAFDPPRVTLFDHGAALMGCALPNGVARLRRVEGHLVCDGSTGTRHALLDHMTSSSELLDWVRRIEELPRWIFEDACARARGERDVQLSTEDAHDLVDWLASRAAGMRALISSHRTSFPGVHTWELEWEAAA